MWKIEQIYFTFHLSVSINLTLYHCCHFLLCKLYSFTCIICVVVIILFVFNLWIVVWFLPFSISTINFAIKFNLYNHNLLSTLFQRHINVINWRWIDVRFQTSIQLTNPTKFQRRNVTLFQRWINVDVPAG